MVAHLFRGCLSGQSVQQFGFVLIKGRTIFFVDNFQHANHLLPSDHGGTKDTLGNKIGGIVVTGEPAGIGSCVVYDQRLAGGGRFAYQTYPPRHASTDQIGGRGS